MKKIVVDASVAIKWFIPEIHSEAAIQLLEKNPSLLAPDLIFAEIGNILWKKARSNELSLETAHTLLNDFKRLPFKITESEFLLDTAWHIASRYQRTFYDSLYLAVAKTENCLFVTADHAFFNALQKTPLNSLLLWVEELKTC